MESLWLQASPTGNGIGLRLVSDSQRSLAVVVFPKAWEPVLPVRRVILNDPEGHDLIALAETEVVELVASERVIELILRAPTVHGDTTAAPLVVPTWARPSSGVRTGEEDPRMMLQAVLSLIRDSGDGDLRLSVENATAAASNARSLQPVLMDLFIRLLGESMRDFRRGYREREDPLPFLRGRPREDDLQLFEAARGGVVRCRFDEFMRATPLNIALVSALEVCIGHLAADDWWGPRLRGSQASAVAIRRALADVPSAPRSLARRLLRESANRVRGTRLEQTATLAAALLLEDSDLENLAGESSVEIRTRTSRLWEDLVASGCSSVAARFVRPGGDQSSGFKSPGPWSGIGSETLQPDILAWLKDEIVVLDAKYKVGDQPLSSADAYQAFAYSHLVMGSTRDGTERSPRVVAMVYPSVSTRTELRGPNLRMPDAGCEFWAMELPFPRINDCGEGWVDYQERLRNHARESLLRMLDQEHAGLGGSAALTPLQREFD